ncbi:hypothetical protein SAMN04488589_2473 [Methanolobus vulcani]|jgi:hypothetical protein|uniref:Uncharacterized protein n=1 Tax=Methanolobus vulcani TaxID=38026 RepID=A0A7Z7B0Y4_9EURY|nr:hypothetical protein [Methanolobus vulcani]MDK2825666.1 hypothetical protein [Methanolobus sp.]MDK2946965.1 hypothetical protein [Methanolobus sp.]SDG24112.1 hypothetical protein SAMN04488589_2473 [Methanolobus vulcani]
MTNRNLKIIIIGIIVVILLLFVFLAIHNSNPGLSIKAKQLSEEPSSFLELTPDELNTYPYIQKAISSPGEEIKVPIKDQEAINRVENFGSLLEDNNTHFIKVNDKYYTLYVGWAT